MVNLIAARSHLGADMSRHFYVRNSGCEAMLGVMAMGIPSKARLAEIIIFTVGAVKEFALGKFCNIFC